MLSIFFGDMPEAIYNTNVYFQNQYDLSPFFYTPLEYPEDIYYRQEIIQDVDKSEVVSANLIDSPVLGAISPKELSGGVKTLLLMANDKSGKVFNASTCGDNCAKWILQLGKQGKLVINLRHLMDFGSGEFKIKVLNTGRIVRNMKELVAEAGAFV